MKNIYTIDDRYNLLYDYLYNINTTNKFIIDKINLNNINIADIKFDIDDSDEYNELKNDILNYKFILLDSSLCDINDRKKYNLKNINYKIHILNINKYELIFKLYNDQSTFLLKINFYTNKNINTFNNTINNDSLFSYLLSYLVLTKKINHILLPILNIDIKYNDIKHIINNYEKLNLNIKNLIESNKILDICNLQLRENYFKLINLKEYINIISSDFNNIKILLFQLIYTLIIIQDEYDGFRHNNLILENIYVYENNNINNKYIEYIGFNNDTFYIPNNFIIKISNFEYSIIPKYYGSFNNINNNINNNNDINVFIEDLINHLINNNMKKNDELNIFQEFVRNNNLKNILYNNLFSHFLINPNKIVILDNTRIINNYNKKSKSIIMNYRIINEDFNDNNILNRMNNMHGGKNITSPFKIEKNTPFISNEQKNIKELNKNENVTKETKEPLLLEQKIYDISKKKDPKPVPLSTIPLFDDYGNMISYSRDHLQQPINKIYNITLANPITSSTGINKIYEDIIPTEAITALTLNERIQFIEYLRNNIINYKDGEEITDSKNSLLSFIKLIEINPYTMNINPYYDIPRNFLLYNAAYPIRFNNDTHKINIANSSMGINIRIYKLSMGDYNCLQINNLDSEHFDVWRELKYYDWIRKYIIKNKVSPNFISPILYKIDPKSTIDWSKIDLIKSKNISKEKLTKLNDNDKFINKLHGIKKKDGLISSLLRINKKVINYQLENNDDDLEDINIYSGKVLILLTEAPTTNIINWASPKYYTFGAVHKMVATGYHSSKVWKSILFQLIYSLSVLQKACILFENFSLENNIYIKDISSNSNNINYWIYKIDDLNYYIPNYGYILIIDSKYCDIDTELIDNSTNNKCFKINSKIYNINNSNINFNNKIFMIFKELIKPDNFTHKLKIKNGSIPDDEILNLLQNIYDDTTIKNNIYEYLFKYFNEYLNKRLGTQLLKIEKDNVDFNKRCNLLNYKGNLIIWQKKYNLYEWVIFHSDNEKNSQTKNIIVKENNNCYIKNVYVQSLFTYPENEKIILYSKDNQISNVEDIKINEIYNFDNF